MKILVCSSMKHCLHYLIILAYLKTQSKRWSSMYSSIKLFTREAKRVTKFEHTRIFSISLFLQSLWLTIFSILWFFFGRIVELHKKKVQTLHISLGICMIIIFCLSILPSYDLPYFFLAIPALALEINILCNHVLVRFV